MDTRAPPPHGPPPSYAFVTRVYKRSLRPVVIFIASLTALWGLFSSIGFFRAAGVDRPDNQKLFNISIALGILYLVVCLIGVFGIAAAATRRLVLVRIFAYLAMFGALVAAAAGLFRVVIHFTMKGTLLSECNEQTAGKVVFRYGWFGPRTEVLDDPREIKAWCDRAWDRDSWSEIVELLIIILIAFCFISIAFSYYRQVLDPTSVANAQRAPSYQARANMYPNHYQPPYGGPAPPYGYGAPFQGGQSQYAPPPGPPPVPAYYPPKDGAYSTEQADSKNQNPFDDYNEESQRQALNNNRL